ncbi:MAG: MFS transporter [Acetobacter orientalis]|uniref:MFS transporter n=2 Tax=Acetobacter orientalis TaxID=146474 RepID=UPI0039ED3692
MWGQTRKIGLITLAAISAADCAAHSMNSLGPFAVGELIKSGQMTAAQAGLWSSIEMLSYAAAMTGIAPHVNRVRLRMLALVAAGCVVVAQTGSAYLHVFWGLLCLRGLSGLGLGALNTVVNVGASRIGQPVFVLSFVMVVQTVVFSASSLFLPYVGKVLGQKGIFLLLACIVLLLMPLMRLLPNRPHKTAEAPQAAHPASGQEIAALLAVLCYTGGSLAVWPFTERIAASVGLTPNAFGALSAFANIFGLCVCLVSVRLSQNKSNMRLLSPALILTGVICIFQAWPPSWLFFNAAFSLNYALWFFIYPSLVGVTCLIDPSGKLASRSGGVWMLSQAATTLLAGVAGNSGQYMWVGFFGFLLCLVSAICIFFIKPHQIIASRSL